jgi:hypothetical protein
MTVSGSGKYKDKPSNMLRSSHFKDHVQGLEENIIPLFSDVITIFVSRGSS